MSSNFPVIYDACVLDPAPLRDLLMRLALFKWINTIPGNLMTTLADAFKALKYRKHAQTYLAAFAYRFNHCFDLCDLVAHLIVDVARTLPVARKVLRSGPAESSFKSARLKALALMQQAQHLGGLSPFILAHCRQTVVC